MRRILLILLVVCAAMNMTAQQLYTDTFRLSEQNKAADVDVLLLDMVAAQGAALHEADSLAEVARLDSIRLDSMRIDSLERDLHELDSLRAINASLVLQKVEKMPTIEIEKSWIKDEVEDRNDVLQAIRNMRSPWRREATLMAQITQNYVTPNWYQGGSSSFAGLGIAKGQISYITDRFTWENFGEWRMGGSTVSADSLHKVNTTDDLFRIYSKANLRIIPKLFTSLSVELETRLLPTYKSNSMDLKSAPFSPLRFNAAFGIDWKPVKNLSISVSPVSYKMIHIADTARVASTDYGLEEGQQTQHNIGSSVRIEYTWKPVREVSLESKFFFYTNYRNVEIDLEVNCDFIINRFLSARLMLHPRYDTSVIMTGDTHAKIQFRELLSIGFAHKFR
ncbi:MAG: DUF3078 domain-containing protein [Paludibacteraceae bacterium]|nr:DUF3078 domain-containing protein [Paludibacteraceae bacterium]